jgi:ubiquitin-activating enzyme E1
VAELNPYVTVNASKGDLDEAFLSSFQAVVMTNARSTAELARVSSYCHANRIAFVYAETRGLFGCIFTDFGESFHVVDTNGEEPERHIISSISQDSPTAVVTVHDESRHGLEDGDQVIFDEVQGMTELNSAKPVKVTVTGIFSLGLLLILDFLLVLLAYWVKKTGPYTFQIALDTTQYGAYERGGVVQQVKVPKVLSFASLSDSLLTPGEFTMSDFAKIGRAEQLHFGFRALLAYQDQHGGELPPVGDESAANEVVRIAKTLNQQAKDEVIIIIIIITKIN